MKLMSWLVAGGTVAGLVAVLSYHTRQMPAAALGGPGTQPTATASATRASPAARAATRTAQGPVEQFGYGQLAVDVTVEGGRITSVTVPSLQTAEPTSQQISEEAIPLLTSEALSGQGLNINAVSGATYTSEAYAQSLQGALDKLHVR